MPQVGNKKFPYTAAGQRQAQQARQGLPRSPSPVRPPARPGAGRPLNLGQVANVRAAQRGRSPQAGGGRVDPRLMQKIMQMLAAMRRG